MWDLLYEKNLIVETLVYANPCVIENLVITNPWNIHEKKIRENLYSTLQYAQFRALQSNSVLKTLIQNK